MQELLYKLDMRRNATKAYQYRQDMHLTNQQLLVIK